MQLLDLKTMLTLDESEFRARFPTTVFPAELTPSSVEGFGVALFNRAARPADTPCTVVRGGAWSGPDDSGVYTLGWEVDELPLDQCKQNLLNMVAALCHQALQQPITFDGVQFPLDRSFIAVGMSTTIVPVAVKGLDNKWLWLSREDLDTLIQQVSNGIVQIVNNEYTHFTAINTLETVADAEKYDVTTGWTIT